MNFEVIKRSHVKRNILIGVLVVLILTAIILTFTKAKYKITESMPLVNGTINYELSDLNLIGAYIQEGEEYKQVNEIPTSGYKFNSEKSYCTVNGENINATINFDIETQTLSVVPLTKKGTKCYLYFDEKASGSEYILASPNAPTSHTTDWTGEESYYYTGTNPDNWVSFAGFYWRIIRINGNGSIRMIYSGTDYNLTDDDTIGTSTFNSSNKNKTYVGLVYDGSTQHGYGTNSTIMNTLNNWYNNNIVNYEANYIDMGIGYCSDREMASGYNWDNNILYYAPYDRQNNGSLQCQDDDILSKDNGKLQNPIGLLTSDEYVLAEKASSYLHIQKYYWMMSPYQSDNNGAFVFLVWGDGNLEARIVTFSYDVRPVINLRSDVQLIGSGSSSDPYVVVTS